MTVTANGKSIAWKFSAWAWGKVIPTDVQELEDFFNRFLNETGIEVGETPERGPRPAPQCKNPQCQKALDKQEIKRVYGQNSAVFQLGYCSARCFTKVATGQ